jgi:neutral ceramidase
VLVSAVLRAGAAARRLDAPAGAPMMGYGARVGAAEGTHDPLFARALYLAADSDALVVECDLCLLAPAQADVLRARIAERSGVPAERILLGCIHTHSGPDTGFGELLAGRTPAPHVAPLFDAVVEAGAAAVASAAPARLGFGAAELAVGRNRRRADAPLDRAALVLRIDRADGSPLAIAWVHGCHPTALGHDNLRYSADWPGAANRAIEAAHPGALALFALGAHADVDPRTRGLLDLAVPGQSAGVGFATCEALGREAGEAIARAAAGIATSGVARIGAGAQRATLETWQPTEAARAAALAALDLDPDAKLGTGELYALERARTELYPIEERRERLARLRRYLRDRTAERFAFGAKPAVEVQVLRIGDALLLGLPLEATTDVGLEWKARAPAPHAALVSIANGWMRYLPHRRNFEEPDAHVKYEILQSTLVPEAAEVLLDSGLALARRLAS